MKKFDLFLAWLHNFFKHPLQEIRQANPIIPGRLYTSYGNICKAVPYNSVDRDRLASFKDTLPVPDSISRVPGKCHLCAFDQYGLPCPIYNTLKNGTPVCDKYKYIILKQA